MRRLLPLLAAACGTAPCDLESCAQACQTLGVFAGQAHDGAYQQVLTPGEYRLLSGEIEAIRAGVRVVTDRTFVCGGAERCERPYPDAAGPLPPGGYHVYVAFETPRVSRPGDWRAVAAESCTVQRVFPDGTTEEVVEQRDEHLGATVAGGDKGEFRVLPFESPAPDGARACNWRITFLGPDGQRSAVDGRYDVPAPAHATEPVPTP